MSYEDGMAAIELEMPPPAFALTPRDRATRLSWFIMDYLELCKLILVGYQDGAAPPP